MQPVTLYVIVPDRTSFEGIISVAQTVDLHPVHCPVPADAVRKIELDCKNKAAPYLVLVQADLPSMSAVSVLSALATSSVAASVPHRSILVAGQIEFAALRGAVQMGVNDILPSNPDAALIRQALMANLDALQTICARQAQVAELLAGLNHQNNTIVPVVEEPPFDLPVPDGRNDGAYAGAGTGVKLLDRPAKRILDAEALDHNDRLALLRVLQFIRRARDRTVPVCADGDPSWAILLFVQEQALLGQAVSVTAACHASTIPQTTAMRKVDELVGQGLLSRVPDPSDRRRINLEPTTLAQTQVATFLVDALSQLRAAFSDGTGAPAHDTLQEAAE